MVNPQRERSIGTLGGRAIGLILGMLVVGGLITVVLTQPALDFYLVPPELAPSLRMETIPQQFVDAANSGRVGLGEWLIGLIPANPSEAAANGDILQLLVFTILSRDSRQKAVATATDQVATRPSTNSGVRATSPL